MRLTQHSGRGTKYGIYNDRHNDRQFDVGKADNIDVERIIDNIYYGFTDLGEFVQYDVRNIGENAKIVDENTGEKIDLGRIGTFAEQESLIYQWKFGQQYQRQMMAYRKKGNHSRVTDFETWRKCKRYCPEEVFYQLGKLGDSPEDEIKETDCYDEIVQHLIETGKKCGYTVLNCAIHMDETGVPQLHVRRVWSYIDSDGVECIGQEKALEQAGIPLPEPGKKPGKYNNRKMTFDKNMRAEVIEISKKYGYEIETEPIKDAKHNRSKEKYLVDLAMETMRKAEAHEKALQEKEKELEQLYEQIGDAAAKAALAPKIEALRARRLPTTPGDQPDQPQATGPETEF